MAEQTGPTGTQSNGGNGSAGTEASIPDLVKRLSEQSAELARKEVELGRHRRQWGRWNAGDWPFSRRRRAERALSDLISSPGA